MRKIILFVVVVVSAYSCKKTVSVTCFTCTFNAKVIPPPPNPSATEYNIKPSKTVCDGSIKDGQIVGKYVAGGGEIDTIAVCK